MLDILEHGMRMTIAPVFVTISDLSGVIAGLQRWRAYIRPPDHLNLSHIIKAQFPSPLLHLVKVR
jgi:hypothetical protein